MLDINLEENYLVTACDKKIFAISFVKVKSSFKLQLQKLILLYDCLDSINQIKIMRGPSCNYITFVDNIGFLHSQKILYDKVNFQISDYKCFDCKIEYHDNSIWSLDCYYPYILIGGNHKCVMIHNVLDEYNSEPIKRSQIYKGNEHNVPHVSFSPNGEFIISSSIDTQTKIWDTFTQELLINIPSQTLEWY